MLVVRIGVGIRIRVGVGVRVGVGIGVRVGIRVALSVLAACQSGVLIDEDDTGGVEEDGAISVSPTSIDLGIVFVGQSDSTTISVTNIGKKSSDVSLPKYLVIPTASTSCPPLPLRLNPVRWRSTC